MYRPRAGRVNVAIKAQVVYAVPRKSDKSKLALLDEGDGVGRGLCAAVPKDANAHYPRLRRAATVRVLAKPWRRDWGAVRDAPSPPSSVKHADAHIAHGSYQAR